MMQIQFTIPGTPVAKGRARHTQVGGFVRTYTPAKTREYETLVRNTATAAMAGQPPCAAPMEMLLEIRMPIPPSWSKKKQVAAAAGQVRATKKPDSANVLKAIEDGLNGVCYIDDSQIVLHTIRKLYHATPAVVVAVRAVAGLRRLELSE